MKDSNKALVRLREQVDRRDISGALQTARQLLQTSNDEVDLIKCGKLLESVHELELARSAYEKALGISPQFSQAHSALGLLALAEGNNEEAIDRFGEAVRLEPRDVGKLTLLGVAYVNLGEEEKASSWLRRALEVEPGYEEANYNLGFILRDTAPDEAEACFLKAIDSDPQYGLAHRELGWLLAKNPSNPEAEYHLRRAIALIPTDAWAHVYLGNYFWDQKEGDAALSEFARAAELAPKSAFPLRALANAYEDRGDWLRAQQFYEQALELEPDNVVTNMNLARMFRKKGDIELAKVYVERALLLEPEYDAARRLLSNLVADLIKAGPRSEPNQDR